MFDSLWPVDCSLPGSSVHRILQTIMLEWVAMPFSRGSSWPRHQTRVSCGSCIAGKFFATDPLGNPLLFSYWPLSAASSCLQGNYIQRSYSYHVFLPQILLLKRFISDFVLGSPGNLRLFTWLYFYQIKQNVKLDIVSVFIALRSQHRNLPQTGEDFWHSIAFI